MNGKRYIKNFTIFCTLIPTIVFGIIGYAFLSARVDKNLTKALKDSVTSYQAGFLAKLEVQMKEVESLGLRNEVGNLLLDALNCFSREEENALDKSQVEALLLEASSEYNQNIQYSLYTSEGTFLTGSSKEEESLLPAERESAYRETFVSLSQDSGSLKILSPIISHNTTVGYLSADISSEYFADFLTKSNDTKFLNTFVGTKQGDYILLTKGDNTKNYTISSQQLQKIYADYETNQISVGTTSFCTIGKSMVSAYSIIPEQEWIFIINTPHLSITDYSPYLLLLFLCYIIIIAFLSYRLGSYFANTLFTPVLKLKQSMDSFLANKPDYRYEEDSFEEFKQLSKSYQLLTSSVSKKNVIYSKMHEAFINNEEELKEEYSQVAKLAYRDALTGLNNRLAFMNYAEEIMKDSNRSNDHHAILFIDLDNFKNVNDTLGHDYGDNLLKQVAAFLNRFAKEGDILARTGGDEFLIFKKDVKDEEELKKLCSSLIHLSSIPIQINEETLTVSMSIGIAKYPENGTTVKELIKNADIAMYTAKSQGRNDFRFFNANMESEINRKKEVIEILREAIKNHDLYLVYQPQASVHTGRITGYEALMRLENPVLGFISPSEFIPIAEECGMIQELGNWALYEACRFNKRIMDLGYKNIVVSVNISPAQLSGDSLIHVVQDVLATTGLPPELLELEITESILMDSIEHNLYIIDCIKELGVKIALDDFGTGYSSLNYLTRIPINTLKIDKTFIDRIVVNAKDEFIADTIITLAHKMDISVIAEGVEEIEQLRILQEQMCDILQGYFFSKPLLERDFEKLLAQNYEET